MFIYQLTQPLSHKPFEPPTVNEPQEATNRPSIQDIQ